MQSNWTTNSNTGSATAPSTSLTQSPFILYFNARSLFNKIDELRGLTHNKPPKIIAVTETWCQPHEQDGLYSIPGYSLTDLTDQTNQEGAPSFIYPVPSLKTSYSIHPMIPLSLHGAMSLPTKSPSPSAVSIDHLTAPTTSLYKHSSNVFVELNSTPTTPSLLGT